MMNRPRFINFQSSGLIEAGTDLDQNTIVSRNLKMLKRATIVGERTAGSAHTGVYYRIDSHFGMGSPAVKPINPFADSDWEDVGVTPDGTR